jgi:gamma-glutamyltranspeptidase/glutathione hydrolase
MPTFTGHTVSIPGAVAGWSDLLARHGRMTLADVLQPAIWTAEHGYPVSELIALGWRTQEKKLLRATRLGERRPSRTARRSPAATSCSSTAARRCRRDHAHPHPGATLRGIAAEGKASIYRGDFARKLSEHVQRYGGWITPADMACTPAPGTNRSPPTYRACASTSARPTARGWPPSSPLNLVAGYDLAAMTPVERLHVMIECDAPGLCRRAAVGVRPARPPDPAGRAGQPRLRRPATPRIDLQRAAQHVPYGSPLAGSDTVYLSVVDGEGNACSFINSLYMGTGSGLVVPGTG